MAKESVEFGKFLGMAANGVKRSFKGDQSILERIAGLTPTLIYAPTGIGGIDQIDDELRQGQKADFDAVEESIYNELTDYPEPIRTLLAKQLATVVGVIGTTVDIGEEPEA